MLRCKVHKTQKLIQDSIILNASVRSEPEAATAAALSAAAAAAAATDQSLEDVAGGGGGGDDSASAIPGGGEAEGRFKIVLKVLLRLKENILTTPNQLPTFAYIVFTQSVIINFIKPLQCRGLR